MRSKVAFVNALFGVTLLAAAGAGASDLRLYSLLDNRVMAHLDQGGLVLDAGSPGFARYVLGNFGQAWRLGERIDGTTSALVSGRQGRIRVPMTERQAKAVSFELSARGLLKGQRVTVFINGKKLGDLEIPQRWQTGKLSVPEGALVPGENVVRLTFRRSTKFKGARTAAAIGWVRFALPDAPSLGDAGPETALARGDALHLPAQGGVGFYLMPPKGTRLVAKVTPDGGGACDLALVRNSDGQGTKILTQKHVAGPDLDLSVPLGAEGGQPMRLDLLASGPQCRGLLLADPWLVAAETRPGGSRPAKRPKRIVFWMIDTLRADRIGAYRKTRVKTPTLDRLVEEGTTFIRYSVEGNESKVSHASVFTGVYPVVHRVLGEKAKLPDRLVTIAEAFKAAGFRTAGLISNGYVSDAWNYHQGFQTYRNYIRENKANDAKAVLGHATRWLDRYASKGPFYLYLGTIDPHVTYRAHQGILELYDPKPYRGRFKRFLSGVELGKIKEGKLKISDRDKLRIEALYDNEVTYNDRYLGDLLVYLQTKGMLDDTLIVVTGDHGDEFWDHGSCGHGSGVYQDLVWVPLIFRLPGLFPQGRRIEVEADGVDIMPTLLDAAGVPIPKGVQGESLLRWIYADRPVYPRTTISTHYDQIYALRSGDWKLILYKGGKAKLFDLRKDPKEQRDVLRDKSVARRYLQDALSLFLANQKRWSKTRWGVPTNLTPGFARDLEVP